MMKKISEIKYLIILLIILLVVFSGIRLSTNVDSNKGR